MWRIYRPLNDILLLTLLIFIAVIIKIHSLNFLIAVTIDFIFSYYVPLIIIEQYREINSTE